MTASKMINKCPSSAIDYEIPDQKWYGEKPDFTKLKPFGCRAYAHVKSGKLNARAVRCIFLGYQDGVKGFRLWDQESKKLLISRDVVFDESKMPYAADKIQAENKESELEVELMNRADSEPIVASPASPISSDLPESEEVQRGSYRLARDRPRRQNKLPEKYSDYDMTFFALCIAEEILYDEPASFQEAMNSLEKEQWIRAMEEEIYSLLKNGTWILVERSKVQKAVGSKWIFKKKIEVSQQSVVRFKARLVAKGYTQQEGIDYNEVFSPVVKHSSIRIMLAIVNHLDWELHQLDVKTAFLNGELEETIFMEQPEGFKVKGQEDKVCLLKKSIYGLKQSCCQWYKKFDSYLSTIGFQKSPYDSCVYIMMKNGKAVAFLVLYVDDMLVAAGTLDEVQSIKQSLKETFEMKDMGEASKILGMDISRDRKKGNLYLKQTDYIRRVISRFRMQDSTTKSVPIGQHFKLSTDQVPKDDEEREEMKGIPYSNIIGSVMYSMICTRPDLAHAVSITSRFMKEHGREHWHALKWMLKYLKGSKDVGIMYRRSVEGQEQPLIGYCDSDYASNVDSRKSQTGYIFKMFGGAVTWKSSLQSVVELSTTEAEYIALTEAIKEAVCLRGITSDFGAVQDSLTILCDNNGAICLAKHQVFHERTKHIDIRLHFIRDIIEGGEIKVVKVGTLDNAADVLTKALPVAKFRHCLKLVGMTDC